MICMALMRLRIRILWLALFCVSLTAFAQSTQQDPLAPTHDTKSAAERDRE
jgi:hypothetical protein